MSTTGDLECIREFCSGSASQDAPKTLARDIVSRKIDLLAIVEALGEYLASSVVEQRCQGTRLLSEMLINLCSHQLPPDDVHYLVAFYSDRLKDKVAVLPYVLRGLHAMVVNQSVSSEDVVTISRAIFSQVYNQSLSQGERRLVYTILDYFLSDYTQGVKEMGSEFVLGYIQAMDGEKDPRNLVIALNSIQRIILHLPFEVLAEDLFEVVACYFPIDFTPPPDDPHAISREQLVLALRKCLTSTAKFTEFCLPLMLEKVSSDLLSAKLDSLLTIAAGCQTFDPKILHTHLQPLWTAIWKEIIQPVSNEVEAAGVGCLEGMSKALGASSDGEGGGNLGEFTEMVLKDCSRHLMEPELKLLGPASQALHAVARGCDDASQTIATATVPLLLQQFTTRSAVSQKRALLQVLAEFINILRRFHGTKPCPLDAHKAELISLVVGCVRGRAQSLVETGLDICSGLIVLQGFLHREEITLLVEHVKQLALSNKEPLGVRERSCDVLGGVAQHYPHITKEDVLPPLIHSFSSDTGTEQAEETVSLPDMSRVLVSLSSSLELQELTLPAFMAVLEQLAQQSVAPELVRTAEAVAGHLCRLVEKTVTQSSDQGTKFIHKMVAERILVLCVSPSLPESLSGSLFREEVVLKQCLSLLRTFTLAANNTTDVKESWATLICEVFLEGSSSLLPQSSSFQPLKPSSPPEQTRLTSILLYTLGAMTREIVCSQALLYLPKLLEQAMHCPDEQSSSQSAMCYASVISKISSKKVLEQFVGPAMSSLWQAMIDETGSDPETRTRSLTAWLWLTKALVLCSHPLGKTTTLKLLDLFGDATLCSSSADGFSVILRDSDILNQKNHSITRLMHKQHFCLEVVPELVSRFNTAPQGEGQYFLRALSYILQCVPRQVMLEQLPLLHPLLLESLNTEDTGLSQSTLEGLHTILQNSTSAAVMSDYVPSLIPQLLTLATTPDSMKVRLSALQCLNGLSKLPRHLVVTYQSQVLRALIPCLDDKKRLVRKEAVRTRANWFMLDTA